MASRYARVERLGNEIEAELQVMEWVGRAMLRQQRLRHFKKLLTSGITYDHQGGDPA